MPQIQQEGKSFVTPDSVHLTFLSVPPRHLSVGRTHPLHHFTLQGQVTPLDQRREYPQHLLIFRVDHIFGSTDLLPLMKFLVLIFWRQFTVLRVNSTVNCLQSTVPVQWSTYWRNYTQEKALHLSSHKPEPAPFHIIFHSFLLSVAYYLYLRGRSSLSIDTAKWDSRSGDFLKCLSIPDECCQDPSNLAVGNRFVE